MRRPTGAAGAQLARHAEATGRVCPKFGWKSAANPIRAQFQESFFGTKYWKCAESDDGNPKKSMILHRMVPSAPLWPGFRPSDGDYVFMCLAPSFLRSPAVRVTRIR